MDILKTIIRPAVKGLFPGTEQENIRTLLIKTVIMCLVGGVSLTGLTACNPEEWEVVDCNECYTVKPEEAVINVKLTLNNVNRYVVIDVYRGRIEEEILILSDTARAESWSTVLPVNEYYSVAATYYSGIADINYYNVTAIDGGVVRARKVSARCDVPCWIITGTNFNVKLKY